MQAVFIARQVIGDRRPAIPAIIRTPQALRGVIEALGVMLRHIDRRIPVETLSRLTGFGLGLNNHNLARGPIVAGQTALLPL